jgi:signal transduction histidine kinase
VSAPRIATARLRRRLAVAFLLVGGASTGALALGSYLIVRSARLDDSAARFVSQSTFNLRFAATEPSVPALFDALRTRGEFCTLVLQPGTAPQRSGPFCPTRVPGQLRRLAEAGKLARQRLTLAGTHDVVVGGKLPDGRQLYFFYDEQQVWNDLDALRNVLASGWLVLTLLAGLVGTLLARRTLAPVAQASAAARSLAEGLLDTRLPVAGSDEFSAWASSFNEMADALEAKIGALSEAQARERRFTANVAHELRTPLTALVGEARLLADQAEAMQPEARRLAGLLVEDVARLRRLTEDLLEISRLDAGSEHTQTEPVNAGALAHGLLQAHGWGGTVAVEAAGQVVLSSDRRRLERIIGNLVANALSHGGGGVKLRVARDGDDAVVEVSDTGPGIPPEALPHVFDRFFKADRSRSAGGTGLGLAIARENARLLGGDITVRSEPGRGAAFTLRLPVAGSLRPGEEAVARTADDGGVQEPQQGGTP